MPIPDPFLRAGHKFGKPLAIHPVLGAGHECLCDQFFLERGLIEAGCGLDRPGQVHCQAAVAGIEHDRDVSRRIEAASLACFRPPPLHEAAKERGRTGRVLDDDHPIISTAVLLGCGNRFADAGVFIPDTIAEKHVRRLVGGRGRWQLRRILTATERCESAPDNHERDAAEEPGPKNASRPAHG